VGENIDTLQKKKKKLLDASKNVGLEVSSEKYKCMLISHYQRAGRKHSINIANRSQGIRERSVQGFGGKARRKGTTWKTEV
jgi:hypothetical protein